MIQYLRRFKYPNSWIFPSAGLSGGIALLWKTGFQLEIVQNTNKMINTIISSDPSKPEFLAVFLYGSVYQEEKLEQWNYISEIGARVNHPWVLIGDLNIILHDYERSTFTASTTSEFSVI